jgi:hypothetical protein
MNVKVREHVPQIEFVEAADEQEDRNYETYVDPLYLPNLKNGKYAANFEFQGMRFNEVMVENGYILTLSELKIEGAALASGKPGSALYGFDSRFYRAFEVDGELKAVGTWEHGKIYDLLGLKEMA